MYTIVRLMKKTPDEYATWPYCLEDPVKVAEAMAVRDTLVKALAGEYGYSDDRELYVAFAGEGNARHFFGRMTSLGWACQW